MAKKKKDSTIPKLKDEWLGEAGAKAEKSKEARKRAMRSLGKEVKEKVRKESLGTRNEKRILELVKEGKELVKHRKSKKAAKKAIDIVKKSRKVAPVFKSAAKQAVKESTKKAAKMAALKTIAKGATKALGPISAILEAAYPTEMEGGKFEEERKKVEDPKKKKKDK